MTITISPLTSNTSKRTCTISLHWPLQTTRQPGLPQLGGSDYHPFVLNPGLNPVPIQTSKGYLIWACVIALLAGFPFNRPPNGIHGSLTKRDPLINTKPNPPPNQPHPPGPLTSSGTCADGGVVANHIRLKPAARNEVKESLRLAADKHLGRQVPLVDHNQGSLLQFTEGVTATFGGSKKGTWRKPC